MQGQDSLTSNIQGHNFKYQQFHNEDSKFLVFSSCKKVNVV